MRKYTEAEIKELDLRAAEREILEREFEEYEIEESEDGRTRKTHCAFSRLDLNGACTANCYHVGLKDGDAYSTDCAGIEHRPVVDERPRLAREERIR